METDLELPEPLISLVRLLLSTEGEWKKAQDKGKLPRPKADSHILSVISYVLRARLEEYSTTIEVSLHDAPRLVHTAHLADYLFATVGHSTLIAKSHFT